MPLKTLTDEKLIKRSTLAYRNLCALGGLGSLFGIMITLSAFSVGSKVPSFIFLAVAIWLITASYWVLAVAAKRGNPTAVGIVLVIVGFGLAVSTIFGGIAVVKGGVDQVNRGAWISLVVPLLVIVALLQSYSTLIELKKRSLWEGLFGRFKPSGHLCIAGAILLVSGNSLLIGSIISGNVMARQANRETEKLVRSFVSMIQLEEAAFLRTLNNLPNASSRAAALKAAASKLDALKNRAEALRSQTDRNKVMKSVLETYWEAVTLWEEGIGNARSNTPDGTEIMRVMKQAGQLRLMACQRFDNHYVKKKKR